MTMRPEKPSTNLEVPPTAPPEFKISGVDEKGSVYLRTLDLCAEFGIPTAGISAAHTKLRNIAWEVELMGGSARGWRQALIAAQRAKPPAAKELSRLTPLCDAASTFPGPDQVTLDQRRTQAASTLAEAVARLAPYVERRLDTPRELEKALVLAEKAHLEAEAAFQGGAIILDGLSKREAKARASLANALAAALMLVAGKLGADARPLVKVADADFLIEFPHRAPPELDALWRRLQRIDALIVDLAGQSGAWAAFAGAAGQAVADVVAALFGTPVAVAPDVDHTRVGLMGLTL
jgi:hypothetical protein